MTALDFFRGLLTPFFAAFTGYNPTGNLLQFALIFVVAVAILRLLISIIFRKEY